MASIYIESGLVKIRQKLKVGSIALDLELGCYGSSLLVDIVSAKLAGISFFGLVKTKARGMVLDVLKKYPDYLDVRVLSSGIIDIAPKMVKVRRVLCVADTLEIDLD